MALSGLDNEPERERCFELELKFRLLSEFDETGFNEIGFEVEVEDLSCFEEGRRGRVGSHVRFLTFLTTSRVVSSGV